MKKRGNIICYLIILLLVLTDLGVLYYFFDFLSAPLYYYICFGCVLGTIFLLILFQVKLKKRMKKSKARFLPFLFTTLIVLFSGIFLYTGVRDSLAMKHPMQATVNQTKFFRIPHTVFHLSLKDTYRMEGTDILEEKLSFNISEENYRTYSYIAEEEYMEYDTDTSRILYSYKYSEDSKLVADYLPVSKKVINLVEITPASHTYTQTDHLDSLEAQITSVIDDCTLEATVTSTGNYDGSDVKEGDAITIKGTMTILYPYNVQGFYEIREGDLVTFSVENLKKGTPLTVTTSVLNLANGQVQGETIE